MYISYCDWLWLEITLGVISEKGGSCHNKGFGWGKDSHHIVLMAIGGLHARLNPACLGEDAPLVSIFEWLLVVCDVRQCVDFIWCLDRSKCGSHTA